jgi:hypothetical protein
VQPSDGIVSFGPEVVHEGRDGGPDEHACPDQAQRVDGSDLLPTRGAEDALEIDCGEEDENSDASDWLSIVCHKGFKCF